jgi:hypothetical protein
MRLVRRCCCVALSWLFLACAHDEVSAPDDETEESPRRGIDGCNCAGATPAMLAPDGAVYPFQSVVAYYYRVLDAFWSEVDAEYVLETWLPPDIADTSEAFIAWQAKTVQILRDRHQLGYTHRYYDGMYGFLETPSSGEGSGATCSLALTEPSRIVGMLAHVGLSQAGVCGTNDDGTTKFWQVNHISLLKIGDVFDALALVDAGLARHVTQSVASRCILADGWGSTLALPTTSLDPIVPCRIAFEDDAVTEGVVLPIPSSAVVAGTPLLYRPFTAAGTVVMPNGLDEVRNIVRDGQLLAMYAVGVPRFVPEPLRGPTYVRLVDHQVGPAKTPSSVLLPDERAWVDSSVGLYEASCCTVACTTATATPTAAEVVGETTPDVPTDETNCQRSCIPEGTCATAVAASGLVVMVSAATSKECFGSCPEPAVGPPPTAPVCSP